MFLWCSTVSLQLYELHSDLSLLLSASICKTSLCSLTASFTGLLGVTTAAHFIWLKQSQLCVDIQNGDLATATDE